MTFLKVSEFWNTVPEDSEKESIFVFYMMLLSLCFQLASVVLKQYVENHWCAQSEKFRLPETTERVSSFQLYTLPV